MKNIASFMYLRNVKVVHFVILFFMLLNMYSKKILKQASDQTIYFQYLLLLDSVKHKKSYKCSQYVQMYSNKITEMFFLSNLYKLIFFQNIII